jgi:hypothetical protein
MLVSRAGLVDLIQLVDRVTSLLGLMAKVATAVFAAVEQFAARHHPMAGL